MRTIGWTSVMVLFGTWVALDDITTDTAQSFEFEYMGLVLSGLWLA